MRDEVFKTPINKQFEFDENVANVFDDMINRSVPCYNLSRNLVYEILKYHLKSGDFVYDLGCSTGNFLFGLQDKISNLNLFGIDNSSAMIKMANSKNLAYGLDIKFIEDDILNYDFSGANAVILNYTLQFIRPLKRQNFVDKIYKNLQKNGVFVFSEKITYEDKNLSLQIIKIYEEYKKNQGYSQAEITQKREALENVLIPFTEQENIFLAKNAGFDFVEIIFKWANFVTFLAIKR